MDHVVSHGHPERGFHAGGIDRTAGKLAVLHGQGHAIRSNHRPEGVNGAAVAGGDVGVQGGSVLSHGVRIAGLHEPGDLAERCS